jgi:hypothetical protein
MEFKFDPSQYGSSYQPIDVARPVGGFNMDLGSMQSWGQGGAAPAAGGVPTSLTAPGGWQDLFSMEKLFGSQTPGAQTQGWAAPALGTLSGLASAWMGMQQYGLAKDALKEGKRQFNLNYDAQKKSYNNELEDRQNARIQSAGSGAGALPTTAETMKKYGLS